MIDLYNDDCLKVMDKLINDGVKADLMLTSPPYNMNLRISNGEYCSRQIIKEISTKYKAFDDNLSMEEYFDFTKKIIQKSLMITDIIFYNIQFLTGNKRALFKTIGEFSEELKEVIIWDKINSQPAVGSGVLNSQFEVLLVFSNSSDAISRKFKTANFKHGMLSNVWKIPRGKKIMKDHGASFPIELAEKVIQNFCPKGGTVIDPFMGTGTTGVAAKQNGSKFIGIELDYDYFNFSKERINNTISRDLNDKNSILYEW